MKFFRKLLIAFLFVVILATATIVFGLSTNLASGWLNEEFLIKNFGENYKVIVCLILILSSILLAVLAFFGEKWLFKYFENEKPTDPNPPVQKL